MREVHLWSEHQTVMAGWPFCGSGMSHASLKVSKGHIGNMQCTHIYGRWAGCHTPLVTPGTLPPLTKGGGLCTAVAPALLLVFFVVVEVHVTLTSAQEKPGAPIQILVHNFVPCGEPQSNPSWRDSRERMAKSCRIH